MKFHGGWYSTSQHWRGFPLRVSGSRGWKLDALHNVVYIEDLQPNIQFTQIDELTPQICFNRYENSWWMPAAKAMAWTRNDLCKPITQMFQCCRLSFEQPQPPVLGVDRRVDALSGCFGSIPGDQGGMMKCRLVNFWEVLVTLVLGGGTVAPCIKTHLWLWETTRVCWLKQLISQNW